MQDAEDSAPRSRSALRIAVAVVLIIALTFGSILTLLVFLGGDSFSRSAESDFLTACVQGGSPGSSCRCALSELEKRYTPKEFEAAMTQIGRTGILPQRFLDSLSACGQRPASQTPA
jgi:hypothetical protein